MANNHAGLSNPTYLAFTSISPAIDAPERNRHRWRDSRGGWEWEALIQSAPEFRARQSHGPVLCFRSADARRARYRQSPLIERRGLLLKTLPEPIRLSEALDVPVEGGFIRAVREKGLEGIVAKRLNSIYRLWG